MDNEKIDKILKDKLQNKISPSYELKDKIKKKVLEEVKKNKVKKPNKYKKISYIVSIAAVALIVCIVGINLNKNVLDKTIDTEAIITAVEPTKLESGILAEDSEFIIYADGENLSKESIQKSIYVEPALNYTIEKTKNKNEYKLKFEQNIPDNTIVKLQYVKDKVTENSWAYQTSNELSVIKTYPENNADVVSKNSTIQVHLSYADVENFEENVTISPKVNGNWKHNGKVWTFKPQENLKVETEYKVKINKEIKSQKQKMEKDYVFSFFVTEDENNTKGIDYVTKTVDKINTFKSDEAIKICYNEWDFNKNKIAKVKIGRFSSSEDFMKYLETGMYSKIDSLGEFKFTVNKFKNGYNKVLQLEKGLQNGYYVASIQNKNDKEIFNCPIQVNDLSAYAIATQKDVLAWVGNDEGLQKGITVKYMNESRQTDKEGIAKFENVIDGSGDVKYITVGNGLIVGIHNYSQEIYPKSYIYTDRPIYKNSDTIKIWGFVPLKLFSENIEEEFYIVFNEFDKQKVHVDEDGSYSYDIKLNNYMDNDSVSVELYYKDVTIASRIISVKNYELQNYNYEIIADKNYVCAGEKYEFDVKVEHVTGIIVPNKSVLVKFKDKQYREMTKEDGIAHFSIQIDKETDIEKDGKMTSDSYSEEIMVYNGDLEEYTDAEESKLIQIIYRKAYTKRDYEDEGNITLYKLRTDRNVNVSYDLKELYDGFYETDVTVNLLETETRRIQVGTKFNEYTNEQEPEYDYVTNTNKTKIKTVKSNNGIVTVNKNEIKTKKSTEEIEYRYNLEYVYKDVDGKTILEEMYVSSLIDVDHNGSLGYIYDEEMDNYSSNMLYEASEKIDYIYYYTYRYLLKKDKSDFNIGDKVNFKLAESTNDGIKDISHHGKLLTMVLKQNISEVNVMTENNFEYEFKEDDFPGCKITSAYFCNGKFYRMPIYYFDFNEETRKVDVEIKSDKAEYKPGEEVTLSIKATNNGKPVESVLNISVSNEAVFNLEDDYTEILENIYTNMDLPVYTFSSFQDSILGENDKGGGGGGGDPRGDFGDTICFETVRTNKNGEAKVKFKLLDNVTTYRATVHSANKDLYVGVNTFNVTSKLDFFIQGATPRNIKPEDDVVLNATSVANEKYDVDYEFYIKELNKTLKATAKANNIATVNFGRLNPGKYHVVIKGKHGDLEDGVQYEFEVKKGNQEVSSKKTMNINQNVKITPSKNPVVLEIYSRDMEKYLNYMDFVQKTVSQRLDTQISCNRIIEFKDKIYNTKTSMNHINNIERYMGNYALKNLENGPEDRVLTALIEYYAKDYYKNMEYALENKISDNDNLFEVYLEAAAGNETVLADLKYLKDEKNISNYNKLLLTLSFEFLGDFQDAKDLYKRMALTKEEKEEYKSLIAIINTFINRNKASNLIDEIIKSNPSDEYVRFAIISLLNNVDTDINKTRSVKILGNNLNEQVDLNGMEVKTIAIYDEDVNQIRFETDCNDLNVSYYYQESLEDVSGKDITKNMKIKINGDLKKNNVVKLVINFEDAKERNLRISLPNSLRLAQNYNYYDEKRPYFVVNNNIDYITLSKFKGKKKIEIPLVVTLDGNYKFENVVSVDDGKYYISNSLNLDIGK